jgi:hypothetical protein
LQRRVSKVKSAKRRIRAWLKRYHNTEMVRQAQALPLRRDMVTLLTFVRDNKVVGTQSTGNMPLKMVRKVTAHFVEPPQLDTTIGDHTYRLRTEADLWPLYFLHILAEVSFLLTVWWYEVNWLVAYPFAGMGDALPPSFNLATLDRLCSLPIETSISFEEFADRLIEETGLTWTAPDSSAATMLLRSSIARMVIHILANFGAVKREYREEPLGKGTISRLVAFEITPFGKALLDAVAIASG